MLRVAADCCGPEQLHDWRRKVGLARHVGVRCDPKSLLAQCAEWRSLVVCAWAGPQSAPT
eukprot:10311339-Prorocentrum_lima.AAC.1